MRGPGASGGAPYTRSRPSLAYASHGREPARGAHPIIVAAATSSATTIVGRTARREPGARAAGEALQRRHREQQRRVMRRPQQRVGRAVAGIARELVDEREL